MNNKNNTPTIEESLEMIEKKLESQKKNKITNKSNDKKDSSLKKDNTKISSLSNLFKANKKITKPISKKNEKDDVILLTKKIKAKDNKTVRKSKKVFEEKDKNNNDNLNLKNVKNLSKTTELAVIINKLKKIKDNKFKNKKKSKKINKEIKKLEEAIKLAEDLFKKELLDL
ncbi:MAG: hypothetical protein CMI94_02060 [Pelagibacteraceae bacterium]|nr:hypothetical protein [Pelagibacteraceae bacterium]